MAHKLERINRFLDGVHRNRRLIVTPEGVALEIDIANHGERLTAFVIDLFFWLMTTLFLVLGFVLMVRENVDGAVASTIILFAAFLVRNLYFIHFELTTQGSTPGKRIVGLKVIDCEGGALTPAAIVARNLTREVETFLPLGLYLSLPAAGAGVDAWAHLAYLGWIGLVSALPFFNKDHRRAGDLIGGTVVIAAPKRRLLAELGQEHARYAFNRRQLETYGAFELQVLEEVLRRPPSAETSRILEDVCAKICRKIGWEEAPPRPDAHAFLTAFYSAERAHLEREQLFGVYRADKTSAPTRE
ncbi:MAG: RDD family protein [Roseiarcus sp.]|jgi:uncharacterized RDD family membrane protein YckC